MSVTITFSYSPDPEDNDKYRTESSLVYPSVEYSFQANPEALTATDILDHAEQWLKGIGYQL